VGEIRDKDSAIVASRAALSGRLVLATIHAQDAAGAVDALHYLGVPHHIIGDSLRLIIAQNLVRQICPRCALPRELVQEDRDLFARFGVQAPASILHADGCTECNSYGYKGRTGIFEVVPVDDEIATMVSSGTRHRDLVDCLRRKGVQPMVHDGLKKVAAGVTGIEEVSRACGLATGAEATRQIADPPIVEMVSR
jgi:type II secretory ATPase GspE/PulE/Tfp pilus assembly ATPase PilB-like protein